MGVPEDPYARPVPMYPGSPGGAVGTPIWPRGDMPPPPKVTRPRADIPRTPPLRPDFVPLSIERCDEPWSRATKVTPTEFRRRCASMRKFQEQQKLKDDAKARDEVRKTDPPDKE